ncbi:MAG: CvpA family protein [Dehalococcoidia bacterium]|nr:CvpA family protein [Dehalococcoidia bacterium]
MNWVDLLIAAAIAWTTFRGLRTGLIRQVVWLVAVLAGLLLAGALYDDLSANLDFVIDDQTTRDLVAFVAIILGSVIAGIVLGEVLRTTATLLMLGPMDSIGGGVVGFIRGLVYVQLALLAFAVFPANETLAKGIDESTLAPFFLDEIGFVEAILPDEFEDPMGQLERWRGALGLLLPQLPGGELPASGSTSEGTATAGE